MRLPSACVLWLGLALIAGHSVPVRGASLRDISIEMRLKVSPYQTAQELIEKAEQNDGEAQLLLAILFSSRGTRDPKAARIWLERAASNGSAEACFWMGTAIEDTKERIPGKERTGNRERGAVVRHIPPQEKVSWYKKAADGGYHEAKAQLAIWQLTGLGMPLDINGGLKLLEEAGTDGNLRAMSLLEKIYSGGLGGIEKDPLKAAEWKSRAALSEKKAAQESRRVIDQNKKDGVKFRDDLLLALSKSQATGQRAETQTRISQAVEEYIAKNSQLLSDIRTSRKPPRDCLERHLATGNLFEEYRPFHGSLANETPGKEVQRGRSTYAICGVVVVDSDRLIRVQRLGSGIFVDVAKSDRPLVIGKIGRGARIMISGTLVPRDAVPGDFRSYSESLGTVKPDYFDNACIGPSPSPDIYPKALIAEYLRAHGC